MIVGMFILFLILLLLNVPIAFSLGASSLFYLLTSNMNVAVLAQKFYAGIDSFTLLCIPGFMLAGALMNGGVSSWKAFKANVPFLITSLIVLMLVSFCEPITLWIPSLFA